MSILVLPHDVHLMIWMSLDIGDVIHLRQTCTLLSTAISTDKQLWAHIFNKEVKVRSLCIPPNLHGMEVVGAYDIESWVRHAFLLRRSYRTPDMKLFARKIKIRHGLRVSWLKIILGRWCVIAAADDSESELSVWEIMPDGGPRCVGKAFLEAPVIDGEVDDSADEVRCAVTIGTRNPYILVIGFYQKSEGVVFLRLAKVRDAACVRFFRGDLVGFAVRGGDDTYPYVADWRIGRLSCLHFSGNNPPSTSWPLPIESCKAMTFRKDQIFSLHRTAIHVFAVQSIGEGSCFKHIATLSLQEPACCGQFLENVLSGTWDSQKMQETSLVYQSGQQSELRFVRVKFGQEERDSRVSFAVEETVFKRPPSVRWSRCQHLFQLGSSERMVFCSTSLLSRGWRHPHLFFAPMSSSQCDENAVKPEEIDSTYIPISRAGLPLLHLISGVDFDDGNGLLLLGTISGFVRIASILSRSVITPRSLRSDLSVNVRKNDLSRSLSTIPLDLNLPLFYSIRRSYSIGDELPHELVMQITSEWKDPRLGALTLSDWSNDWFKFERMWDWVVPLSRWGPLDAGFMEITSSQVIRDRLQTLGEIVPVLYHQYNHRRVVFRIGQRMFYSRMPREQEDDDGREDLEGHEFGILGVLPLTYGQFLTDPASILPAVSDTHIQMNLEDWYPPDGLSMRTGLAYCIDSIRSYWRDKLKKEIDDSTMESWSDIDWDKNYFPAVELEYLPFLEDEDGLECFEID